MPPVDTQELNRQPAGVLCYQVRAVWRGFHRGHPGCALQTQPGQQRGLAARSGTQVQPPSGIAVDWRQGQCSGD
ncbi:Uncharacterised protein [Mycobacterium tuberculosis]|nr:Uncharacterised protein [Mycobacterium tuberculosis]COY51081.1 Uncharacterised protein [Mycobacterium tuberculosis]COZ93309.1 Uncharacterised protein [Mycobacterium tuberculosis]